MRAPLSTLFRVASLALTIPLSAFADEKPRAVAAGDFRVEVYQVADLLTISSPGEIPKAVDPSDLQARADDLIRYLAAEAGDGHWNENAVVTFSSNHMSLVVKQTPQGHDALSRVCQELRNELSMHVVLRCQVLSGPRRQIGDLAANWAGELGRFELEQLEKNAQGLSRSAVPDAAVFSRQTAKVPYDGQGRQILLSATPSEDRRRIRLKISEGKEDAAELVGATQELVVRDGLAAAFYFEAPRSAPAIPPARDAVERLVIVTPSIVVQEEEEELIPQKAVSATRRP